MGETIRQLPSWSLQQSFDFIDLLSLNQESTGGLDNVGKKSEIVKSRLESPVAKGVHQHLKGSGTKSVLRVSTKLNL